MPPSAASVARKMMRAMAKRETIAASPRRFLRRLALAAAVSYLAFIWLDAVGTGIPTLRAAAAAALLRPGGAAVPARRVDSSNGAPKVTAAARDASKSSTSRPTFRSTPTTKRTASTAHCSSTSRSRRVLTALDAVHRRRRAQARRSHRRRHDLSLRTPIAAPGTVEPRYRRIPVDQLPPSVVRRYWYVTGPAERERRCGESLLKAPMKQSGAG